MRRPRCASTLGRTMTAPFKGTINVDIRDSVPDWAPFEPPDAPDGAPNVIYVVLDDVGFSAMEATAARSRRRISTGSRPTACATRSGTRPRSARRRARAC